MHSSILHKNDRHVNDISSLAILYDIGTITVSSFTLGCHWNILLLTESSSVNGTDGSFLANGRKFRPLGRVL